MQRKSQLPLNSTFFRMNHQCGLRAGNPRHFEFDLGLPLGTGPREPGASILASFNLYSYLCARDRTAIMPPHGNLQLSVFPRQPGLCIGQFQQELPRLARELRLRGLFGRR